MVKVRVVYKVTFETLSELHVGSGEVKPRKASANDEPQGELALFVEDVSGNAWIPGSTLKGAFFANSEGQFKRLFGQPHKKDVLFAQGELTFFGLKTSQSGLTKKDKVRTAVDVGTGASAARKLFAQNYVFKGAKFIGDIVLQCTPDRLDAAKAEVLTCLNRFARDEGIPIASGKADGLGRIRLKEVKATEQQLGTDGWSEVSPLSISLSKDADENWGERFDLLCSGPYMVSGEVMEDGTGVKTHKVTHAERINDAPRLFPTGVAGALRARALWLAELQAMQTGRTLEDTVKLVNTSAGEKPLNVVQRLFGDEGYRASVAMKVEQGSEVSHKATQHPAGPLDPVLQLPKTVPVGEREAKGALHKRNADSGVRLRLSLRMWRNAAAQDEHDLLKLLKEDIKTNGLPLGLGTAKGFGWFGIEPTPSTAPKVNRAINTKLNPERAKKLPAPEITLPYRQIEVDPEKIGLPEEVVMNAFEAGSLLSKPLPDGLSGWVDVSWCFETPMLVGDTSKAGPNLRFTDKTAVPLGLELRAPQMLGDDAVIPGTTLRGAMRSLLEAATSARLGDRRMSVYRLDDGDERKDWPFKSKKEKWRALRDHNPDYDENFIPDFVDALFGFISPDSGALTPDLHKRLHLKSRLAFGWAKLVSDYDEEASNVVHRAVMLSPRVGSVFMDHVSRRVYPATAATAAEIYAGLAKSLPKPNPDKKAKDETTVSCLRFLHPDGQSPLVFRGRIRFHNVTQVELGALLWAITLGMGSGMRHMIGTARAFGAGRCYADDLTLQVNRHDTEPPERSDASAAAQFGPDGTLAKTYVDAFNKWLTSSGLRTHGFQERLAAADPAYGEELARQSGGLGYQTNEGLKRSLKDADGKKRRNIAQANGGGYEGKGRLAAMMKR